MRTSTETKTEPDTAQADITELVVIKPDVAQPEVARQGDSQPVTAKLQTTQTEEAQPLRATRSRFGWRARCGLLFLAVSCVPVGWFALAVHRAHRQRDAVIGILQHGGDFAGVHYDYQRTPTYWDDQAPRPGPAWLRDWLGLDFVATVVEAHDVQTDEAMARLPDLPDLEELHMWGNRITDVGFRRLRELPQLRKLTMSVAGISDAALTSLEGLRGLKELSVADSTDERMKYLAPLKELCKLDLSLNPITGAGLKYLRPLTELRELYITGNRKIRGPGLDELKALPRLRVLELTNDGIDDAGAKYLEGLTQLEELNVDVNAEWGDDGLKCLHRLTHLRKLWLPDGIFTGEGVASLEALTQLEELEFGAPGIGDGSAGHLLKASALRHLKLGGGTMSDDVMAILQKSLPNCEIQR